MRGSGCQLLLSNYQILFPSHQISSPGYQTSPPNNQALVCSVSRFSLPDPFARPCLAQLPGFARLNYQILPSPIQLPGFARFSCPIFLSSYLTLLPKPWSPQTISPMRPGDPNTPTLGAADPARAKERLAPPWPLCDTRPTIVDHLSNPKAIADLG